MENFCSSSRAVASTSGTTTMSEEDRNFIPDTETIAIMERVNFFQPLKDPTGSAGSKKRKKFGVFKKKPAKKQMKVKKGFKNMVEKNFQGYPVERCTIIPSLNNALVYIPKNYGAKTRKRYKNHNLGSRRDLSICTHCFLEPCSVIEYREALESTMNDNCNWAGLTDEKMLQELRTRYRHESVKTYNKTWVLKNMPSNNDIPRCALIGTREMVEDSGYDTLLDVPSPIRNDMILNKRDNDIELEEYKKAGWKEPQQQEDHDEEEEESGEESDDDVLLASLAVGASSSRCGRPANTPPPGATTGKSKSRTRLSLEYHSSSDEEAEFDLHSL